MVMVGLVAVLARWACDLTALDWEDQDQRLSGLVLSREGVGRARHPGKRPILNWGLGKSTVMTTRARLLLSAVN